MKKSITATVKPSTATYEALEEMVRLKAQEYIQEILEDEVERFLGRKKSERIKAVDGTAGYRNGHGKPKKMSLMKRNYYCPNCFTCLYFIFLTSHLSPRKNMLQSVACEPNFARCIIFKYFHL